MLRAGDAVVVDIGGTMPTGYCSDCTRTYVIGEPPDDFAAYYQVLKDAQDAACAAVRPGVSAEAIDAAAREPITAAGYGEYFVHRTGHGIGLETHEDPYIVSGNTEPLRPGHAFSVEPGIYPGPHGARIEDIVVCTDSGVRAAQPGDPRARVGQDLTCWPSSASPATTRPGRCSTSTAELADKELSPTAAAAERDGVFPRDIFRLIGRAGLLSLPYPAEFGGGEQPYETYLQVVEELAGAWLTIGLGVSVHVLSCFPPDNRGYRRATRALAARVAQR